jgi:purine-binding chemotaxis protein CheW
VAGNLNLRGRIVTAIDLRARLRLKPRLPGSAAMSLVTEQGSELYALLVDQVSEVLILPRSGMEANPPTLPATWADFCEGIYRLEQGLMVVLSVERLLALDLAAAA